MNYYIAELYGDPDLVKDVWESPLAVRTPLPARERGGQKERESGERERKRERQRGRERGKERERQSESERERKKEIDSARVGPAIRTIDGQSRVILPMTCVAGP